MQVKLVIPNRGKSDCGDSGCPGRSCKDCNRAEPVNLYGKEIAQIAGGFAASQATGGWTDEAGNLIVESVTVFDVSDTTESHWGSEAIKDDWRQLARIIARDLKQDCVYLSFDGNVEFITK